MDGLTVRNAQRFLETGQTASELKSIRPESSSAIDTQKDFSATLKDAIQKVDNLQKQADIRMQNLATGKETDVADVMIATEKADIALKLMVQVRNKIIEAYQEVMKMQV